MTHRWSLAAVASLALVLSACGGTPSADIDTGNPEAVFRSWADASSSGDWTGLAALTCATEAARLNANGDPSAEAILAASSVSLRLSRIEAPVVTGETASVAVTGTYQLVLDETRLQAAIRQALLDGGAPEEGIDELARQGVNLLRQGYLRLLEPNVITQPFAMVRENEGWRVCTPGFSPLTLTLGQ